MLKNNRVFERKCMHIGLMMLLLLVFHNTGNTQLNIGFQPIVEQIGELESAKDPKCHATASRLEDFMFGTPLSVEARNKRMEFQQSLVEEIWLDYTNLLKNQSNITDSLALFQQIEASYFKQEEEVNQLQLYFKSGKKIGINARDYRQYSSIAYALRAILSVQQSYLFKAEKLAPLQKEVLQYFKKTIDLSVLAVLNKADQMARNNNATVIEANDMEKAIAHLFSKPLKKEAAPVNSSLTNVTAQTTLIYKIIEQKLVAYQQYNHINQAVFLRNVQVYFSKILWPRDSKLSNDLKNFYTQAMVQFTINILKNAHQLALQDQQNTIQYKDVYQSVQTFLPHSINLFEDVIYFPNFGKKGQINIEAYDLDAFRDSGLHWQYLKFALDDTQLELQLLPDPFALEILVEGVAQFAVLLLRMGGMDAKNKGQQLLRIPNIDNALMAFQKKLDTHPTQPPKSIASKIISSEKEKATAVEQLFSEVSNEMALIFEHRNSDWLSRLIRSYVVMESENLARLSIPPAFGGGGVAAEDFDKDGWVDVLLLGGRGNRLFKNEQGKTFRDISVQAALDWKRTDGNYGEARQPIIADFDNDGWPDIFISYANDAHRIYRNKGNGTFEDKTAQANLGGKGLVGGPCTALDYDKDGLLDLYIGYFGNYLKGDLPTLKRHNTNGSPNRLFRNAGNFTFQDVSKGSGVENNAWTQAVGHSDINGDGWQDIIVGNDFGINAYYINNQDGTFTDKSTEMGTNKPSYTMNVGIADLNRDFRPDFYISNIVVMEKDDKYVLPNEDTPAHFDPASLSSMRVVEANDLFISAMDDSGTLVYQLSKDIGRGYATTAWSWDADFFDFDNDTDDDLYCLTGMNQYSVYGSENPYYSNPDGKTQEVIFAASQAAPNVFFENKKGVMQVVEKRSGLDYAGTSRSAAYFDMDNDGDLDIVVNDYQGSAKLFRNHTEQLHNYWAKIKLIGVPNQKVPKDAIGSSLVLTTSQGKQLWKEVYSTTGYLSDHPQHLHFGLGNSPLFDIEIRWSNGHIQQFKNLPANQIHTLQYSKK